MSLQLLAEAFKHKHPFCEFLDSQQNYGVSYFRNKFYFYEITTGFWHNQALIEKAFDRNKYYNNYITLKCICISKECISCRVKKLEASMVAIRFKDTYNFLVDGTTFGDSYIERGTSKLVIYTLRYYQQGTTTIGNSIKPTEFHQMALPFMAAQLAPHFILISEIDIITDIRRLIMVAFIDTSFPTQEL